MHSVLKYSAVFATGTGLASLSFIEKNKYTGRYQLLIIPKWLENYLNKCVEQSFETQNKIKGYEQKYGQITTLCQRLVEASELERKSFKLTLIDQPDLNAFVTSDCHIYIYKGLLEVMDDNNELTFVLAHELSHVILKHNLENIGIAYLLMAVLYFIKYTLTGDLDFSYLGELIIRLPCSRRNEYEADKHGVGILIKSGFSTEKVVSALDKLSSGGTPMDLFSTHPSIENRIKQVKEILSSYESNH